MARGENRRESDRAVIAARETGLNRALAGHHWGLALDSYLLSQLSPFVARLQADFARGADSNVWMNPNCMSYQKISIFIRSALTLRPMPIPIPTPDPLFV